MPDRESSLFFVAAKKTAHDKRGMEGIKAHQVWRSGAEPGQHRSGTLAVLGPSVT